MEDVDFVYPSRPDAPILRGLTVTIKPGQRVALVGQSGCGKSTCVSLVERFYDAARGSVVSDFVTITKEGCLQLSICRSIGKSYDCTSLEMLC